MSTKEKRVFWPVLSAVLVCIGALAFVAARPRSPAVHKATAPIQVDPVQGPTTLPRALDPVQNICFTLYDAGIFPREIHVEKGLVSIAIEDRTGKSEGLVIQRLVGNARVAIGQVKRFPNHWRGRGQFPLVPGSYAISDASHPNSRAEIVVAP